MRHRLPYFGQLCSGNNYSKKTGNSLGSGSTLSHCSFLVQCKNQGPWTGEIIKLHRKFQFWFVIPKRFKIWGFFALEQSENLLTIPGWYILKQSVSLLMKGQAWLRSLSLNSTGVYAEAVSLKSDKPTHFSRIIFPNLLKRDEYRKTVAKPKQNCVPPNMPLSCNTSFANRSKQALKFKQWLYYIEFKIQTKERPTKTSKPPYFKVIISICNLSAKQKKNPDCVHMRCNFNSSFLFPGISRYFISSFSPTVTIKT